jgi:hypothetical protein
VVTSARTDRALLEAKLDALTEALLATSGGTRTALPADASGLVVAGTASYHAPDRRLVDGLFAAGTTSYHRPGCRLVDGREEVGYVTAEEAAARQLTPCRVCQPETATTNVTIR